MSVAVEVQAKSFVLLPLGNRRIAFAAESVIELTAPDKLQTFPHCTPWISGVLVRRNRVVPICDVGRLFCEETQSAGRLYLIAEWRGHGLRDWCAIPVTGECELASVEFVHSASTETKERLPFVSGVISVGDEQVEVVDLSRLIQERRAALASAAAEARS